MKGVQCYELFGGIALKNHTFSFYDIPNSFLCTFLMDRLNCMEVCTNDFLSSSGDRFNFLDFHPIRL